MIIITCILIIFLAIVIGFGIWFLNSDNETEPDLQWKLLWMCSVWTVWNNQGTAWN